MDSSHKGDFSDYRDNRSVLGGGGRSPDTSNQCEIDLDHLALDEVAQCDFYKRARALPSVGEPIEISQGLVGSRLAVLVTRTGETLGFMPTRYNHLLGCIRDGYRYSGKITLTNPTPVPLVYVSVKTDQIP